MGTIGSIVGLLGMAFCQMIGTAAGDIQPANCIPNKGTQGHNIAVGLGIASLWLMNICVNVLMGPARAIINDLVEASYLVTANSIATGAMGTKLEISKGLLFHFLGFFLILLTHL